MGISRFYAIEVSMPFCVIEVAMPFCAIEVVMPFVQLKLICLLVSTSNVYDQVGNALEQLYLKFLFIYYWELQCSCSLQHFEFADFGWLQEIHYPLWNSCHLVLEMMGVYILELVVMAILYFTITILLNGQYAFFSRRLLIQAFGLLCINICLFFN